MRLRELFEERKKKVVAVMPGGFHPFHPGHKSLYDWAVGTFGKPNVYVAATDDTKSRPFPFAIKQKLAAMAGVPTQRFIQVKSPFNALSYTGLLSDPENTALVFVRSEKDQTSHPKPDQIRKSDGQMGYIISYNGELEHGADMHGYMTYGPTIDFNFSGMDIKSASELRATWPEMDDESKAKAAELMYPGNGETASKLLNDALGDPEVPAEGVQEENNILDPLRGAAAELFGEPEVSQIPPEEIALLQAMEKYKDDPAGLKDWIMKDVDIRRWLATDGSYLVDMVKSHIKGKPKTEDVSPENEKKFHNELDDLVHKYFGDSPDEEKMLKKYKRTKEEAPPGRERQVKALKKEFPDDEGAPYAIAWAQHNKKKR